MDSAEKSLLLKLIEGLASSEKRDKPEPLETPVYLKEPTEYIDRLNKRKTLLEQKANFKVGDILVWKDGLKNKRLPAYGEPCIVLKVYEKPLKDEDNIYDMEDLDIQIGFITPDDEFLCFNYDSSRLRLNK